MIILRTIKRIFFKIYKSIFQIAGKILVKDNKLIMFESFLGKQFSDNPRAIYEYLKEHYPEYKLYWSIERRSIHKFEDKEIKSIKRFSLKWLYLMNRAKYWITNSRLPLWIPKPSNTIYVQTWHGTPLKKLATDMEEVHMPGTNTEQYKRSFLREANKWDFLISPNAYSTEIFKRAFSFNKNILETGYPRNDYLINNNNIKMINKIKSNLGIPIDKKIILYAPTWRDNQYYTPGKYKFRIQMDLDLLKRELSTEYCILLRLHYLIAENLDFSNYKGFIFDLTFHDDIRDLYLISDILVTDYSSVFFDYAILKRPMIFYVYDLEEYRDTLRGFYFDFENEAPGPLVKTTEELISSIISLNEHNFPNDKFIEFHNQFCYLEDGKATERVVNNIFSNNS